MNLLTAVLLMTFLHQSTCIEYCIAPTQKDGNSSCMTLSQFAGTDYGHVPGVTLLLLPGNHSLDVKLSLSNISEFRMLNSQSTSAEIFCESPAGILIEEVDTILVNGLTFVGCGEIVFNNIFHLLINNSTFTGSDSGHAAVTLRGINGTNITKSTFSSIHYDQLGSSPALIAIESMNVFVYT